MSGATKISGELQAGTSGTTDSSAMETEEYYNPEGGEWSQKVDTGQLCRVCANPNEYLIPIFDGEGLEHELSVKIEKHLPIKVTETDALPQQMCYQCASTLIAWHDLVLNCVEADKKLRELQADEDDDDDDKGAEMFESHSMDSDPADEVDQPSTSESQITAKLQVPKKTVLSKDKKPKLKMVLVKGSLAGTSGQKTVAKTQVAKALELAKSKEGGNEDSASERYQISTAVFQPLEGAGGKDTKNSNFSTSENEDNNLSTSETDDDSLQLSKPKPESIKSKKGLSNDKSKELNKCEVCGKVIVNKTKLNEHKMMHMGIRPFICDSCGKQFLRRSGLKRHVLAVHEKVKNFVCDLCGLKFAEKSARDHHRRTHTGERPYVCEECGKCFASPTILYCHKRIHRNYFPYSCSYCGKKFRTRGSLSEHVVTHTNERNHTCHICGHNFGTRGILKDHLRCHSEIRPFVCNICGRGFKRRQHIKTHLKTHDRTGNLNLKQLPQS